MLAILSILSLSACNPHSVLLATPTVQADPAPRLAVLRERAMFAEDLSERGDAILALAEHPNPEANAILDDILAFANAPLIVRSWAAAARINRARTMDELAALVQLANTYPAAARPLEMRVNALSADADGPVSLLEIAARVPSFQSILGPAILGMGVGPLMDVLLTHQDNGVRRLAAGFVGGLFNQGSAAEASREEVMNAYRPPPRARVVTWRGGALYVPQLRWDREEAIMMMNHLVEWHLVCDVLGLTAEKQQVYNNLRSVGLWRQAGMRRNPSTDTRQLLRQWGEVVGQSRIKAMLSRQGVRSEYADVAGGG